MDRKIAGMGVGVMLIIGLVTLIGFVFAQNTETTTQFVDADNDLVYDNAANCPYKKQAGGFVDVDADGVCDNVANCPGRTAKEGCKGAGGCGRNTAGFTGRCHKSLIQ
jgi:hypothetical protein